MDSKFEMFGTKLLVLLLFWVSSVSTEVTYDRKAIIINGKRRILISGSIHYPRSTPEMWPDLIDKAKKGGVEVIQTYVFWDGHEPTQGQYYFGDRYDLVRFIKNVQQAGLYVNLRIGPFICGEWNFGGFPVWLKFVPGISFRTDNKPFEYHMQKFTTMIVEMMKKEKLFEWQGGPIILAQIENEYGPTEWELKTPAVTYRNWAAQMALDLKAGVPWIMCKQDHAPNPIITTCNGFYCHDFKPDKDWTPKMWTELWTGWYTEFGGSVPYRPVQDVAFGVARFIQNGGSYVNYYMYHGGTNFGRTAGGPLIATSYDYDAPLDEYGLERQEKWGHLRDLHNAIKQSELALVSADANVTWLGKNQEAHVYSSPWHCAAFLANYDTKYWVRVKFWNGQFDLPPWSISILPDCKTEVFNTAKVKVKGYFPKMVPVYTGFQWQSSKEWIREANGKDMFTKDGLWEQLSLTWDKTDYLWYTTDITVGANDFKAGQSPVLTVMSAGPALQVFLNGQLVGKAYGTLYTPAITFTSQVKLNVGVNKLSLLSSAVGLANVGLHFETWNVGVLGPVTIKGLGSGMWDLSKWKWSYKVGVDGETKNIYTEVGTGSVGWDQGAKLAKNQPVTWYKTYFNAPGGYQPLALDMGSMGKGQMWINGRSIGRHWPAYHARGKCNDRCDYAGWYDEFKCRSECGKPSQRWYHVPRSWLKPTGNLLVVFEEWGGDPTGISLVERK